MYVKDRAQGFEAEKSFGDCTPTLAITHGFTCLGYRDQAEVCTERSHELRMSD
jgi:hypothetical protein